VISLLANLHTYNDLGLLALRIGLAAVFLTHGTRKWPMWKTQPTEQLPLSMLKILRALSIAEPVGAIATLLGLLTPLPALGFAFVMVNAIILKKRKMKQPFVNPDMSPGWEFEFIILTAAIALFFLGAGAFSLDRLLFGV
jgi:putative oxidoreductase